MMGRLKMIYATILAVIYVTASLMSSLSVLSCDHPHHTHHAPESIECRCGNHHSVVSLDDNLAFNAKCCDHDHELLSDNHTQFFVEKERDNSAHNISYLHLAFAAIISDAEAYGAILSAEEEPYPGYESLPLRAAFSRYDSLRAPPVVA